MRVILLLPKPSVGGAELFVLRLCRALPDIVDFRVVFMSNGPDVKRWKDIPHSCLGIDSIADVPRALLHFAALVRDFKPDVVQSFLLYADTFNVVTSFFLWPRWVPILGLRNGALPVAIERRYRVLFLMLRVASWFKPLSVIAVHENAQEWLLNKGVRVKFSRVIPNFRNEWVLIDATNRRVDKPRRLNIGHLSRGVAGKGHQLLLDAFAMTKASATQYVRLRFAGPGVPEFIGEYCSIPAKVLSQLEVEDYVDSKDWFASIDLFVLSSTEWESWPNALDEAVGQGIPVIAADLGSASLIAPAYSLIVPNSPIDLANKIDEFIFDIDGIRARAEHWKNLETGNRLSQQEVVRMYIDSWQLLAVKGEADGPR